NNKPVLKNEIFYIKMLGINIRRGASPPSEPLPEQAVTDGALRRISVERPPYTFTENNQPAGSLIKIAEAILKKSGLEFEFAPRSTNRMLAEIKSLPNTCVVGFFKTPERETFAKFTQPIYQNAPMMILIRKTDQTAFSKFPSLKQLFTLNTQKHLKFHKL
ncbi:MAG: substrate-binding periplasmic protein, partial [Gammaproteobacteria bacterium]